MNKNNIYPALYRVTFCWFDDEQQKCITEEECGIIYASNFTDAMKQVEDWYGEELEDVNIQLFAPSLIKFPVELYDILKKQMEEYL